MSFKERAGAVSEWYDIGKTAVELVLALGGGKLVGAVLRQFSHINSVWITPIWLISAGLIMLVLLRLFGVKRSVQATTQAGARALASQANMPAQVPQFNLDKFFQLSHTSQLTQDTEQAIKTLVAQQYPNDREDTLARFIGIGYWGYMHDITWAYIFRSQILALTELNSRNGLMPLKNARAHYDQAKSSFPRTYSNYSFIDWLDFMAAHQLLIKHPADMLEITLRGRDFLKYLTHYGMNAEMRKN